MGSGALYRHAIELCCSNSISDSSHIPKMRSSAFVVILSSLAALTPALAAPTRIIETTSVERRSFGALLGRDHINLDNIENLSDEEIDELLDELYDLGDEDFSLPRRSLERRWKLPPKLVTWLGKTNVFGITNKALLKIGTGVGLGAGLIGIFAHSRKLANEAGGNFEGAFDPEQEKILLEWFANNESVTTEKGDAVMQEIRDAPNVTAREVEMMEDAWDERKSALLASAASPTTTTTSATATSSITEVD